MVLLDIPLANQCSSITVVLGIAAAFFSIQLQCEYSAVFSIGHYSCCPLRWRATDEGQSILLCLVYASLVSFYEKVTRALVIK